MTWRPTPLPKDIGLPYLTVSAGPLPAPTHYAPVNTAEDWFKALQVAPKGELHFFDEADQPVFRHLYLPIIDPRDVAAFYCSLKRVFIVERMGVPMISNGQCVMALPSITSAHAWHEVQPPTKSTSEKVVPYVSIEHLEAAVRSTNILESLKRVIAQAREGCP